MKRAVYWLVLLVLAAVVVFAAWPYFANVTLPETGNSAFGVGTVTARVTATAPSGAVLNPLVSGFLCLLCGTLRLGAKLPGPVLLVDLAGAAHRQSVGGHRIGDD